MTILTILWSTQKITRIFSLLDIYIWCFKIFNYSNYFIFHRRIFSDTRALKHIWWAVLANFQNSILKYFKTIKSIKLNWGILKYFPRLIQLRHLRSFILLYSFSLFYILQYTQRRTFYTGWAKSFFPPIFPFFFFSNKTSKYKKN